MDQETKSRLSDRSIWVRILYMVILVIAYSVAEAVLVVVSIFQFLTVLFTGSVNEALQRFGANLSAYQYAILQFATFNREDLPFPFNDWPDVEPGETPWSAKVETETTTQTMPDANDTAEEPEIDDVGPMETSEPTSPTDGDPDSDVAPPKPDAS
jgi:hypothetical protein